MKQLRFLNLEPENYSTRAKEILSGLGIYEEGNIDCYKSSDITRKADVLIVRLANRIDAEFLKQFPNLRYILTATTGLDHIDIDHAKEAGIKVLSLREHPEFLKEITSTAELTWGLILSLIRNIPAAISSVKQGSWNRDNFRGIELKDKVLGIIGLGRLGTHVARYAAAFGMYVKYYDPYVDNPLYERFTELTGLLKVSDIVTLHVHLNQSTYNLLNDSNLNFIKHGAYLINTSRGGLIDEFCLLKLLESGKIKGVAVDVLKTELQDPLQSDLYKASLKGYNVLITPHIGGAAYEAMEKCEYFVASKFKEEYDRYSCK